MSCTHIFFTLPSCPIRKSPTLLWVWPIYFGKCIGSFYSQSVNDAGFVVVFVLECLEKFWPICRFLKCFRSSNWENLSKSKMLYLNLFLVNQQWKLSKPPCPDVGKYGMFTTCPCFGGNRCNQLIVITANESFTLQSCSSLQLCFNLMVFALFCT